MLVVPPSFPNNSVWLIQTHVTVSIRQLPNEVTRSEVEFRGGNFVGVYRKLSAHGFPL
jgi:hypothetical protein